jgi:hypothetical protein
MRMITTARLKLIFIHEKEPFQVTPGGAMELFICLYAPLCL